MKRRRPKTKSESKEAFFSPSPEHQTQSEGGFFQPKLEIDPVDSPAEKEADAVANQVVNRPKNKMGEGKQNVQRKKLQRQAAEEEPATKRIQKMEEEEPAAKRIQKQEEEEAAQTKRIQKQEEEEAQTKRIQKMEEEEPAAKRIQKQEEEEAQTKRIQKQEEEEAAQPKRIQKMEEEEPAAKRILNPVETPKSKTIQKMDDGTNNHEQTEKPPQKNKTISAADSIEDLIDQRKGKGRPLPEELRIRMEQEFGADFSKVRIHTDPEAIFLAKKLQAHAFTHGYDIFFNKGRFQPDSKSGVELLAHELTHVVQQKGT